VAYSWRSSNLLRRATMVEKTRAAAHKKIHMGYDGRWRGLDAAALNAAWRWRPSGFEGDRDVFLSPCS
jgi:hypothetical protein